MIRILPGMVMLGVGMTLGGSGPSILCPQLGMWIGDSWILLLGMVVGGLLFALLALVLPLTSLDWPS